jgi:hypothetical protein
VPGIRRSRGLYLEVLDPATLIDVPIEVDVFSGANPATMLATLEGAFSKRFTRELSELGSGGFALARNDPKATADNLAIGNLVKFKVAGTYRHAIWIEEPAATVVSRGEEAGESVAINGRGALAYLERATVYPPVWPPAAAYVAGSSSADNGTTGTTSLAVPKPAGAAAGDVAIVAVLCTGALAVTPPGWRRIRDVTEGTLRLALYVKRLLSYEPASTSWHWAAATKASAAAIALRNASDDDPSWAIADTTGSGTAIELPSVAVNLVDGVLVTLACSAANTSIAPGAGLTELVDRGDTGRTVELAVLENPALGDTGDLTATAGSSASWIGLQMSIPSTAAADAVFGGATFGGVLASLIDEAQIRGTLPVLTYDFTATADSHGEPWPDVHDLSFHIGTSLLEVWRHLVTLGLEGGMTPDLRLQAYVDSSRHFESTVILRKGHHLIGDVVDTAHGSGLRTRMLVEGAGGRILEISDPTAEADGRIGRREGYLSMSTSDNATTLQRAGDTALASAAAEDQARSIAVVHGPASEGQFEPWVDYREGDWIGLDADGSGGVAVPQRVASITLEETEAGDFDTELELNSVEMDAFLRLQRRLDALSRSSTASGSGGASGGGSGSGRVGATSSDTPGYLFDKLDVAGGLTKQLAGDVGVQRVRLTGPAAGAVGGFAPLSSGLLVPAAYLGTGTPSGSTFLRGDGVWALPPAGEAGGFPTFVQQKYAGTQIGSITLDAAPGAGHTILLALDMYSSGGASSVSSSNTTWTKVLGTYAGAGSSLYDLWVGKVGSGGVGGAVISITHPNGYCSGRAIEISDPVTPTVGATLAAAAGSGGTLAGVTAGHLVVAMSGNANTGVTVTLTPTAAPGRILGADAVGASVSIVPMWCLFAASTSVVAAVTNGTALLMAELS